MTLAQDIVELLESGVAHQLGACTGDGRPVVCRGLAATLEPDGLFAIVLSAVSGFEVIEAVRDNGRVSVNVTSPQNYRSVNVLGADAAVSAGGGRYRALVEDRRHKFRDQLARYGFPPDYTDAWYCSPDSDLMAIRFKPVSIRSQTPGPGAGLVLELYR